MGAAESNSPSEWIAFGPFLLFPVQRLLKRDSKPIRINDKALDLLITLIERPGDFFTKAELVERVWRREWVEDINLRVTVSALRKLLGHTAEGGDYVINAVGRGYSFSAAVLVECWPRRCGHDGSPESPADGLVLGRLPMPLNPVIGREREIRQINALLEGRRLVTIVGPGGIGKTTVAISSASRHAENGGSVSFIDFAPTSDPTLVPARIAATMGCEGSGDPLGCALRCLSQRQLLVVLDNCEHVAKAVAEIAENILRYAPGVAIIVTSREPLRAEGEVIYRLDPLTYPPAGEAIDSERALTFSAVQLFVERTKAALPGFVLTDALAAAASEICRRLDGMALAIELAAGRVPAFGVTGVTSRLDDRFRLLSYGHRTALPRHYTLEAAFHWSFGLLTARERTVFKRISAFCGSFTIDAAVEIAGWPPVDEAEVAIVIADLVDKSLVVFVGDERGPSYRLLETVRDFGQARLQAGEEAIEVAKRHAQCVSAQCRQFASRLAIEDEGLARDAARGILDDLRSALKSAFRTFDITLAIDLLCSAIPLLTYLGLTYELRAYLMRVLEVEMEPERRLRLLSGLGGALRLLQRESDGQTRLYGDTYHRARERGVTRQLLRRKVRAFRPSSKPPRQIRRGFRRDLLAP